LQQLLQQLQELSRVQQALHMDSKVYTQDYHKSQMQHGTHLYCTFNT